MKPYLFKLVKVNKILAEFLMLIFQK
jgi:hypothetical protein